MTARPFIIAAALLSGAARVNAQIPPSLRAPAPPAIAPADLQAQCADLKAMINAMKIDVVWARQPYSNREIAALQKMARDLGCSIGELEGTWQVTGSATSGVSNPDPNFREDITLVLKAVSVDEGADEADKQYGPVRQGDLMCRRADTFYTGTLTYSTKPQWVPSSRVAHVIACGNSNGQMTGIAGRFGVWDNGNLSSTIGGGFILTIDAPGQMHGSRMLMSPGAGSFNPWSDWTLKKTN